MVVLVNKGNIMVPTIASELVIPKTEGRAFELLKGQTLRIIAHQGRQVADLFCVNLHDKREKFSTHEATSVDPSMRSAKVLYSGPPFFQPLLTVSHDRHGMHWIHGRCNAFYYKRRFNVDHSPNCHDNIVNAMQPWGLSIYDVPLDTFNVFMVSHFDDQCRFQFSPPTIEKGDFVDMRADRDLLVAISACPNEDEVNDFAPKDLKIQILQS